MNRAHAMPFGAQAMPDGQARFRLWAPDARRVDLVRSAGPECGDAAMQKLRGGWFELTARADASTRYAYRIDGDIVVPDPASRSNPDDVHGASALVDPLAFDWPDAAWRGRPWHEAVIYELHVGCFTPEGTFAAAIGQLDALVALGVSAIELMPVADFAGRRGWGYDGVLPFAPDAAYGTPDDLKRLVAAAHARGLMVLLDVVYNHFGPEGNYLHRYASAWFNDAVNTPWGAAINFDGEQSETVREFFIHNALYWIEEFRFDGLRLDAVHAMHDASRHFITDAIAHRLRSGPGRERHVHLVLENERNDAARLKRTTRGTPHLATAQWNDDVHHALHVMCTGERDGYYVDYADDAPRLFARALAEGFGYQGEPSTLRDGAPRGTPSAHLPPLAFVNSTQTHDQVGNRAHGERIAMLAEQHGRTHVLRALLACVLLAPAVPMLFMGEEFAAGTPFLYFCDFTGDLARAVTEGRRNEFRHFARFADPQQRAAIPDPNDEQTFQRSKLNWAEREQAAHREWLAFYRTLLALRRDSLVPWLPRARGGTWASGPGEPLHLRWPLGARAVWHLRANLSDAAIARTPLERAEIVYDSAMGSANAPPWSVQVALQRAAVRRRTG
jgi:maltooligosyltrehalose trehalohydrolase